MKLLSLVVVFLCSACFAEELLNLKRTDDTPLWVEKRCRESRICPMHKNYGRCDYSIIASQCPCSCAPTPSITDFESQQLNDHNKYRALHGSDPLKYNKKLGASALKWCNQLARENKFYHSSQDDLDYADWYGENLYYSKGYPEAKVPGIAVQRWYDEIKDYDFKAAKFSALTGHFTQVVWKGTKEMGCGVTSPSLNSERKIFVCCHYQEPGNYTGEFADNVKPLLKRK